VASRRWATATACIETAIRCALDAPDDAIGPPIEAPEAEPAAPGAFA
jgi:hypothetical protein